MNPSRIQLSVLVSLGTKIFDLVDRIHSYQIFRLLPSQISFSGILGILGIRQESVEDNKDLVRKIKYKDKSVVVAML